MAALGGAYADYEKEYDPAKVDWKSFLTDKQMEGVRSALGQNGLTDSAVYALAAMSENQIEAMRISVTGRIADALDNGVRAEYLESAMDGIRREIGAEYTDTELSYLAMLPRAAVS